MIGYVDYNVKSVQQRAERLVKNLRLTFCLDDAKALAAMEEWSTDRFTTVSEFEILEAAIKIIKGEK